MVCAMLITSSLSVISYSEISDPVVRAAPGKWTVRWGAMTPAAISLVRIPLFETEETSGASGDCAILAFRKVVPDCRLEGGEATWSRGSWEAASSTEPVTKYKATALMVTSAPQEPRQTQPNCWPCMTVRTTIFTADVMRATAAATRVRLARRRSRDVSL